MPLDLDAIRKQQEDKLNQLLAGRPQELESELAKTRGNVEADKNAFYGNTVNPLIARIGANYGVNLGSAANASNATYKGRLATALNRNLDSQRLQGNKDRVSLVWENAYRRAKEAKADEQSARAYAYQVANDESRRQFQTSEAQKNAEQRTRNASIQDYYAQAGLDQEAKFQDQNSSDPYEQALTRALTGLAGAGLTAYGLNKMQTKPEPMVSKPYPISQSDPFYSKIYNPLSGGVTRG